MDGDVMQSETWKAGAAKIAITPNESMWLGGWAARREPGRRGSGELFCKALALEDEQRARAVIVTMDLIAVPSDLASAVAAKIQERWNISRESLLFNCSHTHTGPEIRPDKVSFFEIPAEYAAKIGRYRLELEEKIVRVIDAALKNLKPAKLNVARGIAEFARNRRNKDGVSDHDVTVLEATGLDGKRIAILFGYACHNLTLPYSFCEFHGDYAGVAQQKLEKDFIETTAMFCAGAGADQEPEPRGTVEFTNQHGEALAEAVKKALGGEKRAVTGNLRVAFEEVPLPFAAMPGVESLVADAKSDDVPRRHKAEYLLAAMKEGRTFAKSYPCPVQVLRVGDELLLIALGGEPVAEFARILKQEFAGLLVVWVAGYSNDMFGYLPTRRVLREGGYEGGRALYWSAVPAPFIEDAEEIVLQAVRRLVKKCS